MSDIIDRTSQRIPEWLSLADISQAWSEETGEDAAAFEASFRGWFEDYLLRNAYGGEGDDASVPAQLLEGQQIWRETFETFCEEQNLAKPRFWFPEGDPAAGTSQPAASEPLRIAEAEAVDPPAEAPKRPTRRRVREGSTSFTWIAAGLVVAVAAGSVALWLQDMGAPMADASVVSGAAAMAESAMTVSAGLASGDLAQVDSGLTDSTPTDSTPTDSGLAVTEIAADVATVQEPAAAAEPVPSPAPTTISDPAAAQIAAVPSVADQADPDVAAPPEAPAAGQAMAEEVADQGLVLLLQRELQAAGYDPGPLDGRPGTRFAAAIAAYQRANNLHADGRASIDMLSRLARENLKAGRMVPVAPSIVPTAGTAAPASEIGRGTGRNETATRNSVLTLISRAPARDPAPQGRELVRAIQKRLAVRGYYDGPLDGNLGPKTSLAIETYQRVQRYNATGRPSRAIYEELEDYSLQVRGLDQFQKGAYDAAVATYSRIIRREPKNADAYFNRGLAYKNVGRTEQALTDYDAAIELDPDHRKAHFDRANILYDQGLYGEALRTYYKALKLLLNIS
jgi:tetratricopeptide (TPR) repeat protein